MSTCTLPQLCRHTNRIDVRRVIETDIEPVIDTGICQVNSGRIGVGMARMPMVYFLKAMQALSELE